MLRASERSGTEVPARRSGRGVHEIRTLCISWRNPRRPFITPSQSRRPTR